MDKTEGLNALLEKAVSDGVFPGACYVVVSAGGTFMNSFGFKTLLPVPEKNGIDTLYDMASVTKVLATASCIMKLVEEGKLRLEDPVSMYLPEFIHKEINIWDLMTHSSGLPADVHRANHLKNRKELEEKIYGAELRYPKNTDIVYSDIGFILLGLIAEKVSGMPLDKLAEEKIFAPLEMIDTGFNRIEGEKNKDDSRYDDSRYDDSRYDDSRYDNSRYDDSRYAATEIRNDEIVNELLRGKVHDEKAYIMGGVAGHAGLFSCVKDIGHFITMILNDGVYQGVRIFSPSTVDLLFRPQVRTMKGVAVCGLQRGLGWIVGGEGSSAGDLISPETIFHTGFTGTSIFIDRINRVGFALLTNRVHPTRDNKLLLGFRPRVCNYVVAAFGERNV